MTKVRDLWSTKRLGTKRLGYEMSGSQCLQHERTINWKRIRNRLMFKQLCMCVSPRKGSSEREKSWVAVWLSDGRTDGGQRTFVSAWDAVNRHRNGALSRHDRDDFAFLYRRAIDAAAVWSTATLSSSMVQEDIFPLDVPPAIPHRYCHLNVKLAIPIPNTNPGHSPNPVDIMCAAWTKKDNAYIPPYGHCHGNP